MFLALDRISKKNTVTLRTAQNYTTRFASNQILVHPLIHFSKVYNSFFLNGLKLWNDLPVLIKNERSLGRFKNGLRLKLFVTSLSKN